MVVCQNRARIDGDVVQHYSLLSLARESRVEREYAIIIIIIMWIDDDDRCFSGDDGLPVHSAVDHGKKRGSYSRKLTKLLSKIL